MEVVKLIMKKAILEMGLNSFIRPVASGGGGHIIPTQYYVPPQIFRPCDGPAVGVTSQ